MQEPRATRRLRQRVANACDVCKQRKIKCSGTMPCSYCTRRQQPEDCHYTAQQRRKRLADTDETQSSPAPTRSAGGQTPAPSHTGTAPEAPHNAGRQSQRSVQPFATAEEHEETEVPREARLLCDPHGKLVFIGDCAPLSFFQTVRQLVTSLVDAHAFAPETSGYSALENTSSWPSAISSGAAQPPSIEIDVDAAITTYLEVTSGVIDLFDNARLCHDISTWAAQARPPGTCVDVNSAVNYLVLAIGCSDDHSAQLYFAYAREVAFASLSGNLGVESIQAFVLSTLYMLAASQINGAFLFFGIAVRAAYSIGLHRTAVNSRFGPEIHRQRDRLWKSLRVVDLFLSTSMGRPPATSDTDCTVPYREVDTEGRDTFDVLNASVQIFLITEAIVLEVYSRRKISPRLTEGISRELREWSTRWLPRLKAALEEGATQNPPGTANGACQIISSYYYAVILVSRPFFMVELRRRLSEQPSPPVGGAVGEPISGKSKLADACVDAAILMVEPVLALIERGSMIRPAPVIVSWLFASSLVLGLGLLGGFGRIIEKSCRGAISALEYFGKTDGHAKQYSLIAKSLLATSLEYLEKKEMQERSRRTESSSQLFGLVPQTRNLADSPFGHTAALHSPGGSSPASGFGAKSFEKPQTARAARTIGHPANFSFDFESSFLGLAESFPEAPDFSIMDASLDLGADQALGGMNLFPLLESDGHIDLANFF
ncbi:filamentous growth regulator 27 [Podospora aff. communis PSN243]|uniref:Filamentous growth regulator 27 n=1 Tax=Podospora aff. communis PSN243 TaxID=3040156 RepID=A0AAV9G9M2_9PEZI|nr:filamentous growth regulator 27 [Podospora aff. communis PSN243]